VTTISNFLSTTKNKIIFFGGIATLVIVALIVTLLAVHKSQPTALEKVDKSQTYSQVEKAVTVSNIKPGSVVVAPADEKWWKTLLEFSSNNDLANVDFNKVSKGATYVAYSNSNGIQYAATDTLGLSTTFVAYDTEKAATEAYKAIMDTTPVVAKGNLLLFVPQGAFSDIDYSLKTNKDKIKITLDTSDIDLNGQAVWRIDFDDFSKTYTQNKEALDIEVYNTTLKMLGITKGTEWMGYSKDGLNWSGKFYTKDNEHKFSSPNKIITYLNNQIAFLKQDGSYAYGMNNAIPEDEQTGVILPRQSIVTSYMRISDNKSSAGGILNKESGKVVKGEALPKNEGIYQVEIEPNSWLSFMMNADTSSQYTKFSKMTLTMTDDKGNSKIALEPVK
jgi:hypothetical protein